MGLLSLGSTPNGKELGRINFRAKLGELRLCMLGKHSFLNEVGELIAIDNTSLVSIGSKYGVNMCENFGDVLMRGG